MNLGQGRRLAQDIFLNIMNDLNDISHFNFLLALQIGQVDRLLLLFHRRYSLVEAIHLVLVLPLNRLPRGDIVGEVSQALLHVLEVHVENGQ